MTAHFASHRGQARSQPGSAKYTDSLTPTRDLPFPLRSYTEDGVVTSR